jgi:sulfopyruvate decarboxylase subunit alpha
MTLSPTPSETVPRYAEVFLEALRSARVEIVAAVPESLLKAVYHELPGTEGIRYVPVSNEAEMPGICVGAYLGGKRAIMIMENSGLRQACEPIARFAFTQHAPFVMVMAYRGDLGERNWWGHAHAQVMTPLLEALRIPFRVVRELDKLPAALDAALTHADSSQWPVALVLSGDCINGPQYAAA